MAVRNRGSICLGGKIQVGIFLSPRFHAKVSLKCFTHFFDSHFSQVFQSSPWTRLALNALVSWEQKKLFLQLFQFTTFKSLDCIFGLFKHYLLSSGQCLACLNPQNSQYYHSWGPFLSSDFVFCSSTAFQLCKA